jgi:signal peptidase I
LEEELDKRHEISILYCDILDMGYIVRVQATGKSMKPFLKDGDILYIRKVIPSSLNVGDIILFKDAFGQPIAHRIVKKIRDISGRFRFQTKGDALNSFDDFISEDVIRGKVYMIERRIEDRIFYINLESLRWRLISYYKVFKSILRMILSSVRRVS